MTADLSQPQTQDPMDATRDLRTIEAAIFAAGMPLSMVAIANFVPHLDTQSLQSLLARLKQDYEGRGVNLEQTDAGYAFRTAPDLAEPLSPLCTEQRRLSRASMETLAVIAYHQPVTRAEIEEIRGVGTSRGTLDLLLETDWIKPGRRRESPGRPLTWVTTSTFLDHFGLESIVDLPGLDDLKASGMLDRRPGASLNPDLFDDDENDNNASEQ